MDNLNTLADPVVHLDFSWGLDHGTWSVLCRMFPTAEIPVVQLSLDFDQPPDFHFRLGRQLTFLRSDGVLVIGSGNMVHNLRAMARQDEGFDWAVAAGGKMKALIAAGDHHALIDYPLRGDSARLAIPTREHYLPLLYTLAMQEPSDRLSFFCEWVTLGSISMRSYRGAPDAAAKRQASGVTRLSVECTDLFGPFI
ncbi:dioxygenase [Desulfosarcina sp.]|uniref:dioxygenase family protein n=1 Tax=Desulfosarcina sp. TaxID=2027861 RepID=UPI003970AE2A